MNREIKFRGKQIYNGGWIYGYYGEKINKFFGENDSFIIVPNYNAITDLSYFYDVQVDPLTVGQYTGLKDQNGVEIYDGDVLDVKLSPAYCERIDWEGKPDATGKVFWDLNAFELKCKGDADERYADFVDINLEHSQVIGNVHDNPELLGGK
jgi:uncharacterized phage protein (TIGR01671 family)